MSLFKCRICDNQKDNTEYILKEMMYGFRDVFKYIKCKYCGCLQIASVPINIDKYYPSHYYSFSVEDSLIKKILNNERDKYSNGQKTFIGKILVKKYGHSPLYNWLKPLDLKHKDKILEVGSGNGRILKKMAKWGFCDLTGIDPYIDEDVLYSDNIKILKKNLEDLQDVQFDLIMLHHSLEHMEYQYETLEKIYELLKANKFLIVRIPVIDTIAWKEFGINWVQLDAPRHFFLHSIKSMKYLAEKCGFCVQKIIFDSNAFQFWGSEQHKNNIPTFSENSYMVNPYKSLFTKSMIKQYEKKAEKLNIEGQGDQAIFYLQKNR